MKSYFLPRTTVDNQFYWDGLATGQLLFQQCKTCGHMRWPASVICPVCYSSDYEVVEVSGKGKLYSFVVFRRAFHPKVIDALPYIVATIDLIEGPRILASIDYKYYDILVPDMPVVAIWDDEEIEGSIQIPTFVPEGV